MRAARAACRAALWAALVLARPSAGLAHSPMPGIEGFYVGLIHPLSTPPQLLPVLALGLLLGLFAPDRYRLAGPLIAVAALLGLFLGQAGTDYGAASFAVAAVAAALGALFPGRFPVPALAAVAAGALLLGMHSVPDPGPQRDRVMTMAGSFAGINLALLYLAAIVWVLPEKLNRAWVPVALRVAGAWVAAIAALMLALSLAPVPG